jgi:hypothetical protein
VWGREGVTEQPEVKGRRREGVDYVQTDQLHHRARLARMADEQVVFVRIFVVGDSSQDTDFVYWQVEAEHLRGTVANLAKHVCNSSGLGTVALTKMQFFVAKCGVDSEPTADEERAALLTKRLQVTQHCNTIKSGFLLAVVDKLTAPGKHPCPSAPTRRPFRPFAQVSFPRLLRHGASSGP